MRRALVAYLEEEGIKAKVEDGQVEFEYNQCTFTVDFILLRAIHWSVPLNGSFFHHIIPLRIISSLFICIQVVVTIFICNFAAN